MDDKDLKGRDYEAPAGTVWVCSACGKRARHRGEGGISSGWDESCMMHAVLCHDNDTLVVGADKRVKRAEAVRDETF